MTDINTAAFLDNREAIQELDASNVLGSVQALADQIEDAWTQVDALQVSINTDTIHNVVISGMGGSQLGPDVIKRVFKSQLTVPFEIYNDYALPAYVDEHSLVILSSYSGTTEEVLAATEQAIQSGAQIMVITTGGKLAELMREHNWPGYIIDPKYNPSNQPRMAIGYAVFGVVALLAKAGLLQLKHEDVISVINRVQETARGLGVDVPQDQNPAKQMAFQFLGRIPVLIAAEHLEGSVHVFQNQLNENAKSYAEYRVIPELNHHLMEGLRFPENNDNTFFFVLFNSPLYHERIQKRMSITQQVIEQRGADSMIINVDSATRLEQAFEVICFGAYVNFYLAMLEGIDPAPIPTVDFFKKELA